MISCLILTLNEEDNLPRCLAGLSWCDDIIVLDSGSTDRTCEIARAAGARVFTRPFDDERSQREFSLRLPFKHAWVYNPDADEVTPQELTDEMHAVVASNGPAVAYRCRFKNMFLGRWIRHSSLYPTWVVRLFRPERVAFSRRINLAYEIDGPEGRLSSHFIHYTFNRGIEHWIAKHNRYSTAEAAETLAGLEQHPPRLRSLCSTDPVIRRQALKALSLRLPFRPLLRFGYMYGLRLGFLDGSAGFHYCCLVSWYEHAICLKSMELRLRRQGKPV